MAHAHPIAAGVFVTAIVALIGYGASRAVVSQREAHDKAAQQQAALHKKNITDGVARGQEGDLEGAVALLAAAYKRDPNDIDAAYNLGIALAALGRYDDAEKLFSGILAKEPGDWDATAELAAVYDARGDGERAMQLLQKIPEGKADVGARFADEERWASVRGREDFAAFARKHGIQAAAATVTGTQSAAAPVEP